MKYTRITCGILTFAVIAMLTCKVEGGGESLPELTTATVTNITEYTATVGGNITNAGEPEYTERGVVYSTTQNPDADDNKISVAGSGKGSFSAELSGLTPNTKYYVRAYAIHADGTVYGNEVNFTTLDAVISTNAVTGITVTTAILGGRITELDTPSYTERGVVYATAENPTVADFKVSAPGTGAGNFTVNVGGLEVYTRYYARAYIIVSESAVYGNQVSFTTSGILPELSTNAATGITATTAMLGGNIAFEGTPHYSERGVVYATTENPTTDNLRIQITGTGTGDFSANVTGLTENTDYYVRAYAINAEGVSYGNELSFKTLPSGIWIRKADFAGTIREGAVILSIGNKGYIGTGQGQNGKPKYKDFWEYDPISDVWTQKADFAGSERAGVSGFSIGNKGYIGTGYDGDNDRQDFWEYDPEKNIWTKKADFAGGERAAAISFSIGNKGYIGTGVNNGIRCKDFWEYDPVLNKWTKKADFAGGNRIDLSGFSIGNKGYVGMGWDGATKKDFWEYDPVSDKWTQKADFPGASEDWINVVGFYIGNKGYFGNCTGYKDFWEYDPATDKWKQKAYFPANVIYGAMGFSTGNKGYVYFGIGSREFWEFTP